MEELEILKEKATLAYLGWAIGNDVITPMNELRTELERQGVDIKVIKRIYNELKKK